MDTLKTADSSLPAWLDDQIMTFCPGEPVDFVYTWVNNPPEFQKARARWLSENKAKNFVPEATNLQRFRDLDEIRHSLRSVEKFATWVRKIFIVTNGQVPEGINFTNPAIQLVTHAEIFPEGEYLPVFSNVPIEACLHRIPGLSRWFIYFNNDFFLGAPVQIGDFLDEYQRPKVILSHPLAPKWQNANIFVLSTRRTIDFVNTYFGSKNPFYTVLHVPSLLNTQVLFCLEKIFTEQFEQMRRSPFRSATDFHLQTLYAHVLVASEKFRTELWAYRDDNCEYISLRDENFGLGLVRLIRTIVNLVRHRPKFLCLNDELGQEETWRTHFQLSLVRWFYRVYYHKPSAFEKNR